MVVVPNWFSDGSWSLIQPDSADDLLECFTGRARPLRVLTRLVKRGRGTGHLSGAFELPG
ncbi:hypothetical protein ACFL3B_01110 [Gemmatimonadota bacterium]